MPPTITTYLRYSDFNRAVPSTLEQFEHALKAFPLEGLLRVCCALNVLVSNWDFGYDENLQARIIREFLPPEMAGWAIRSGKPVFHRHQLLFTAREALKHCPITQEQIINRAFEIGNLLLMASDHLGFEVSSIEDPLERLVEIIRISLPSIEASRLSSYVNTLARGALMNTRFLEPLRGRSDFVDVSALFEKETGVPLRTYFVLLWGAMSRFSEERLANASDVGRFQIPMGWFQNTKVPFDLVDSFFHEVSASPDELASRTKKQSFLRDDFVIFQDKPLIRTSVGLFPIDLTYLAEKFYKGPFWRVNYGLPDNQRESFHSLWGEVFEDYMTWVLKEACEGSRNRFIADPRYESSPKEQVSDALVICDRAAILIEYKGNTFRASSKYNSARDEIKSELEAKLVTGSDNSKKGVQQLAHAVERLCRYDKPDGIEGVDFSGITTVFPVMVLRDDIGSVFGMNLYLNHRFQFFKPKGLWRSVTPLFCFSADDVERLSPYLSDAMLTDLIEARHRKDKNLAMPFWMVETDLIKKLGRRKPDFFRVALSWLRDNALSVLGMEAPAELSTS